jgi:hypothetical protein
MAEAGNSVDELILLISSRGQIRIYSRNPDLLSEKIALACVISR